MSGPRLSFKDFVLARAREDQSIHQLEYLLTFVSSYEGQTMLFAEGIHFFEKIDPDSWNACSHGKQKRVESRGHYQIHDPKHPHYLLRSTRAMDYLVSIIFQYAFQPLPVDNVFV